VKFLKKQNAAKVKALENKDLRTYDLLTKEGKIEDKQFVYDYLEEEMSDGKSLDIKVLNKEYAGMPLDKSAY
jgi:nucleoid-associated protein YejK